MWRCLFNWICRLKASLHTSQRHGHLLLPVLWCAPILPMKVNVLLHQTQVYRHAPLCACMWGMLMCLHTSLLTECCISHITGTRTLSTMHVQMHLHIKLLTHVLLQCGSFLTYAKRLPSEQRSQTARIGSWDLMVSLPTVATCAVHQPITRQAASGGCE